MEPQHHGGLALKSAGSSLSSLPPSSPHHKYLRSTPRGWREQMARFFSIVRSGRYRERFIGDAVWRSSAGDSRR